MQFDAFAPANLADFLNIVMPSVIGHTVGDSQAGIVADEKHDAARCHLGCRRKELTPCLLPHLGPYGRQIYSRKRCPARYDPTTRA